MVAWSGWRSRCRTRLRAVAERKSHSNWTVVAVVVVLADREQRQVGSVRITSAIKASAASEAPGWFGSRAADLKAHQLEHLHDTDAGVVGRPDRRVEGVVRAHGTDHGTNL